MLDQPLELLLTRRRRAPIALAGALAAASLLFPLLVAEPAAAETVEHGNLVVSAGGGVVPRTLPSSELAPVRIDVAGTVHTTDGVPPPRLREFMVDVNRHGRVFDRGLPRCRSSELRDATTRRALKNCRDALVGRGHVSAEVDLPGQAPFPAEGELLAFNARIGGRRAVLGHVFGVVPVPTTAVVPFLVNKAPGPTYGARLVARVPQVASDWGYVAAFRISFGRRYRHDGEPRSYLNASCPAPRGFPGALFDLARISYQFEDEPTLATTIQRSCRARRD